MHIYVKRILCISILLFIVILFCEYLIFELSIFNCSWPTAEVTNKEELRIIFIADPHLLGPYRGHWLDKLRREWQMKRCFQASYRKLDPDYVIILGDLFDEGELVNTNEWQDYLHRFYNEIFYMPDKSKLKVIVGNHDIGFHHTILENMEGWYRFKEEFHLNSSVQLFQLKHRLFISINSMAMDDDYCDFCYDARLQLNKIKEQLVEYEKQPRKCNCSFVTESRIHCILSSHIPILLQHFPLYRENESPCTRFNDGPSPRIAAKENEESWDVLSIKSTQFLLESIRPCFAISGHTHHGCYLENNGIFELSVPSFSWRNLNNPSVVLATFVNDDVIFEKCSMPKESTVILVYIFAIFTVIIYAFVVIFDDSNNRRKRFKTQ